MTSRKPQYTYIADAYGVTFAPGDRVKLLEIGGEGIVARENQSQGHYVMVKYGGLKHARPFHPRSIEHIASEQSA